MTSRGRPRREGGRRSSGRASPGSLSSTDLSSAQEPHGHEISIPGGGSGQEMKAGRYPVVGLEQADDPEEHVDVGEEEQIGEEQRMASAPFPEVARGGGGRDGGIVAVEEREEEDERRKGNEEGDAGVLQIPHSFDRSIFLRRG